jgi:hypothetical protein
MKVRDLEGNIADWRLRGVIVAAHDPRSRSTLHLTAREMLYEIFPTLQILEEVPINPRPRTTLYLDFYINQLRAAIEVHGQQHYKFNSLYHSTAQDFLHQKRRDEDKKEWCDINNITYIELPYNENREEWKNKITHR